MLFLVLVGLLAGLITSLSPCVLPVLPVILSATVPAGSEDRAAATESPARRPASTRSVEWAEFGLWTRAHPATRARRPRRRLRWRPKAWRPYGVVAGLVLGFSASILFGSFVLRALNLPPGLLRTAGIVVLVVVGLSFLWPRLAELLERPFARVRSRRLDPESNGLVLGLGLGLLFVPCAGPVLAAIAVVGASQQITYGALALTAGFGVGIGLPLLALALAGRSITRRTGVLRRHAPRLRAVGGVVMIVMAVLIGLNLTDGLQRRVPGYTAALQQAVEERATDQLRNVASGGPGVIGPGLGCVSNTPELVNCGLAPELTGISGWLNTPGGRPLSLAGERGKVVLIDFWTYSCINCQRPLPQLEAWNRTYRDSGLTIIGVHTPEFAFEQDMSNVSQQSRAFGVQHAIALDNDYGTWKAYKNHYWPATYLIDKTGAIRHVTYGEGQYDLNERLIRQLLTEANPGVVLPPPTSVPDTKPKSAITNETFLGFGHAPLYFSGSAPMGPGTVTYRYPGFLADDTFALDGTWRADPERIIAGPGARLQVSCLAQSVHLILGGRGDVRVELAGQPPKTVSVNGPPTLYTLADSAQVHRTVVNLALSPGLQAYSFTFG